MARIRQYPSSLASNTETKVCAVCQRPFTNRKSWRSRGQWADIRYCSERCRRQRRQGRQS